MLISLTVGKVDAGVAVLLTEDKRLIEFPSILLPPSITSGSIVDINVARNTASESAAQKAFAALQSSILTTYGLSSPKAPVLRCRNATQTSIVLEWDKLDLATATLRSLSLFRNGAKAGSIPYYSATNPGREPVQSTKISGLAVDTEYTFHLVLRTSAGTYSSEKLRINTQKMTDLTGVTITPGPMPPPLLDALKTAIERIGMKFAETVRIDTTHFVCTEGRGPEWEKAKELNVPVVRPEWVEGCEREGRIVGVRGYYLGADPKSRQVGQGVMSQPQYQQPQQQQQQQQQQLGSSQGAGQQDLQRREAEALAMRHQRERADDEEDHERGEESSGPRTRSSGMKTTNSDGDSPAQQEDSPLPPPTPAKDDYRPTAAAAAAGTTTNAAGVPSSADDESEDGDDDDDIDAEERRRRRRQPQPRADDESDDVDNGDEEDGERRVEHRREEEKMTRMAGGLRLGSSAANTAGAGGKEEEEDEDEEEEAEKTRGVKSAGVEEEGEGEGFSEVAL